MDPYRLPTTVLPSRYDIRLEPDLAAATFAGRVVIAVDVREPVAEVVLNAAELSIAAASLEAADGGSRPAGVRLDHEAERCHLTFAGPLPVGPARLTIDFSGLLNDKLRGFYRSSYPDGDGNKRWLAATQFEATDARRCFPCWDEPAFKAVFASTLVLPANLQAVSNTRVVERTEAGGKATVRFADTIRMSTYLVAYIVGELEASPEVMVGDTPLRVWSVPGKQHLTGFGRDIGAFSLGFFEGYYGRRYPGDKLDLVAIPDFAAGAMENLGCITFRETALLVDEATATHAERERVADVVAHENAHMWFGDLVTMRWWNGLWLNEAFATFMEMLAVDAWKPQWQRWTTFGVSRSAALAVDGLRSTRPIEFPVTAPRDADAMFDVLTYEKGASVLRMLEQYLGADAFRNGVRLYLERHAFGSTETVDLWNALGEACGLDVAAVMHAWIYRPGYPLVGARLDGEKLVLTQERFQYLPNAELGAGSAERSTEEMPSSAPTSAFRVPRSEESWRVPLQVRLFTPDGPQTVRQLLEDGEAYVSVPPGTKAALVNEGGHGFFRVRYAPALLQELLAQLPGGLSAIERFNLVNDAWALTLAGHLSLTEYLDLTARCRGERDRNVWSVLTASFAVLHRLIDPLDRPRLEALIRDRLAPAVAELGWQARPDEGELTRQLRGDLLRVYGTLGNDAATQARAADVDAAGGDADVLAAAVAVLAYAGTPARYEDFEQRRQHARTPQEEQRYLLALAGFRQPELIARTLARTLDGDVRTQDAPFVLRALLSSVDGREPAWAFVREQWDRLAAALPLPGLRRMCEGFLGLVRPEWEAEVRAFAAGRQPLLGGKTLDQYLEQLHVLVRLREREGAALRHYLAEGA